MARRNFSQILKEASVDIRREYDHIAHFIFEKYLMQMELVIRLRNIVHPIF